jgi:EmrB/QacA subfamily drug resistance transporter
LPEVATTRRHRLAILAILCTALLIGTIDITIVNVALPSIGRDFHSQVSGLQWVVDAYTLVLASLLMLSGSVADRVGRRRVFMVGLCVFTVGSLLCSLAANIGQLVAFRMLQAIGGSMLTPVALSIIRNTFEDPGERARAIGLWGATVGVSLSLGPVVGGVLVHAVDWRAVFWINLPVGVAAFLLTMRFVPESRAPQTRRLDPVGQLLVIVALASLTFAIIEGPGDGWGSAEILGTFALSAIAFAVLARHELRRTEPLLELRFFRSIPFSGAALIALAAFAALGGFLFLNTLYLQEIRGFSALKAGLCTLPLAVPILICAPLSGRLVAKNQARVALLIGGCGIGVGALLLTPLRADTSLGLLFVAYAAFGIGFGMVNPPITNAAVAGMPPAQAGVAAAIASTSRQVGTTLGVAIVGAAASSAVSGAVSKGFVQNSHTGWWIIVFCGAAVAALGIFSTTARATSTAKQVSARFT